MFVTTKIVVGKLGYIELAAVGIAGSLSFEVLVITMGLLSIVGVLCAQAEGAGRKKDAGLATRQGIILSLVLGIPVMALIWNLDVVLKWTGQDAAVISSAKPFLVYLSPCVLPVLFFAVLRNFISALAKPMAVMVITVIAVVVNYWLTVWLVYGAFGIQPMGVAGAGLATTLVSWLMFFCLLCYVYITPSLRGYGLFADRWQFDGYICKEILYLGIPVAGLVVLEAGMFSAASILSGIISAETLAAYEVVNSWAGIPFVIAMGIAEATMVRVANGVGRDDLLAARKAGFLGMGLGTLVLVILMIVPLGFAAFIIDIFVSPEDPGYATVSLLATQFFFIAALFQVFDGLQGIAARALRGVKDSIAPLWIAGFGYWILGIGGGAALAFGLDWEGIGIWWGMAMGLTVTGSLLCWRFNQLTRRMIKEELDS